MDKERRWVITEWLKGMQANGAFDGFMEENMDFDSLKDDELEFYEGWYAESGGEEG